MKKHVAQTSFLVEEAFAFHQFGDVIMMLIAQMELTSKDARTRHVALTNFLAQTESASHCDGIATKKTIAEMVLMNYNAPGLLVHLAPSCAQLPVPAFHNCGSAMGTTIVEMALMSRQISVGLNHPMHAATVNSCAAAGSAFTRHGNVTGMRTALMAPMKLNPNVAGLSSLT